MTTQINNLSNNTKMVVKGSIEDFKNEMIAKGCSFSDDRSGNGWLVLNIKGVKMILDARENN